MRPMRLAVLGLVAAAFVLAAAPSQAAEVDKTFPFELDRWYDLDVEDGPITLHRIRVTRVRDNVKAMISRPGNAEYLETVRIEIEYSHTGKGDREADLKIHWLDADGTIIDGYDDDEDIDEESARDEITATWATLKYGLDVAKKLDVQIRF